MYQIEDVIYGYVFSIISLQPFDSDLLSWMTDGFSVNLFDDLLALLLFLSTSSLRHDFHSTK